MNISMKNISSIFWFRQDLRLLDNLALIQLSQKGTILPIYIFDNLSPTAYKIGAASKLYLHYSLESLNASMKNTLNFYVGNPEKIIFELLEEYKIQNIYWNRCYEPWYRENDYILEKKLTLYDINHQSFNGSYLFDEEEIKKKDNSYYKVFSSYRKKALEKIYRKSFINNEKFLFIKDKKYSLSLSGLELLQKKKWSNRIKQHWTFGEIAAQEKLQYFIKKCLLGYKKKRNYPAMKNTSMLSVNLHFGEISPYQVWEAICLLDKKKILNEDVQHFLNEILWREFSCYLLQNFQRLYCENFQVKFNRFPWKYNEKYFHAWKTGMTGYPMIDAGMRELWQTGYMHNRMRMIVASFLVKNLMIHWHYGQKWFFDCLVDADMANNSASWQWVAGSGVDAAPYFRIFNPVLQGEKFDKEGIYTKKFIPELEKLPNKYLFKPWEAPLNVLEEAEIVLGIHYPKPIVDLSLSRQKALQAYRSL